MLRNVKENLANNVKVELTSVVIIFTDHASRYQASESRSPRSTILGVVLDMDRATNEVALEKYMEGKTLAAASEELKGYCDDFHDSPPGDAVQIKSMKINLYAQALIFAFLLFKDIDYDIEEAPDRQERASASLLKMVKNVNLKSKKNVKSVLQQSKACG